MKFVVADEQICGAVGQELIRGPVGDEQNWGVVGEVSIWGAMKFCSGVWVRRPNIRSFDER